MTVHKFGKMTRSFLVLVLGVFVSLALWATPAIDNTNWDGSTKLDFFGTPYNGLPSFGQSITLTQATQVSSFTFSIGECNAPVNFRGHIYAWNGSQTTGNSLYDSAMQTVPAGGAYTTVTLNADPSLILPAGQYVLFISTNGESNGSVYCYAAGTSGFNYGGGSFVYSFDTGAAQWTSASWAANPSFDMLFSFGIAPPPGPTVTSISPTSGSTAGGSPVVITGTDLTGATAVKFGATSAASFTVNSASQITATSPAGVAGVVDVTVTTSGGTSVTSAADQFTYVVPAPTVIAISPTSGSTAGGSTVVITGTDLTGATAVKFGATSAASFTVNSASQITATSPAGAAGVVDVTVTTSGGTSSTSASDRFTYAIPAPAITQVTPSSGLITGNTTVTLTGANFTGATAVKFGATNAASFTVVSPTQVTAVSPAGAVGVVNITVTTPGGTSATSGATQFTYTGLRQVGPISAAAGGGTISVALVSASAGCVFDLANTSSFVPPVFNNVTPPLGGLRLKVTGCTPGETIQLTATFSNLNGMTARKYGVTPTSNGASVWYSPTGLSVSGNTITYSVTDNGLGDDTFTGADGIINDPIVPLPPSAFASGSIPTLSEWAMTILVSLMAVFACTRLRRRRA